ncbi:MAG: hypothetical protein JSV62_03800 [Promethearchaeota archaeon]|nr:MAG: hypothetical protein JSV62_03800 [Candidatus Lokiarchaeota archaeon]
MKRKIAILNKLSFIHHQWKNKIGGDYYFQIKILETQTPLAPEWCTDDEAFLKIIREWERSFKPGSSVDYLYKQREEHNARIVELERLKKKSEKLKSRLRKLGMFIREEFKKIHQERNDHLINLLKNMKKK